MKLDLFAKLIQAISASKATIDTEEDKKLILDSFDDLNTDDKLTIILSFVAESKLVPKTSDESNELYKVLNESTEQSWKLRMVTLRFSLFIFIVFLVSCIALGELASASKNGSGSLELFVSIFKVAFSP